MYSIVDIKSAIEQPYLFVREFNTLWSQRLGLREHNPNGTGIFDMDWDNLIILDACRYDIFSEVANLPGELEQRETAGAATREFIDANFAGEEHHDTVYVTGNSWILKLDAVSSVHTVYDVIADPDDGNKPTRITDCAIDVAEKHPNKRLIVHFIRPHHPFIGPLASSHFADIEQPPDLYNRIQRGEVDISDSMLRQLYIENLEYVLPYVEKLMAELKGKTIVTSDHGELLGERTGLLPIKTYGHIPGLYTDKLVTVPCQTYQNGSRREIFAGEPRGEPDYSYAVSGKPIDKRLRELGYKL
ncbi:hypothetical protein [Natrarchaeobius chitinivorans]|uniref:hypothetical protein n=1 Tax=Natrarchaeobius chitinivorans TaxID=1679083 RepID=UPI000F52AB44|nr:hypothetical protein [Natrarchaeobius chitinivorans]